jgi:diguanylate cyclase (GGDEF)-like protein/PAS domain S-box-containing protein
VPSTSRTYRFSCPSSGVTVPLTALFRAMNSHIERAIGAEQLKPGVRSQLLVEQVKGIAQMTPVTAAGALVASFVLLAISRGTPAFESMLAWSAALYVGLFATVRGWLRGLRATRGSHTGTAQAGAGERFEQQRSGSTTSSPTGSVRRALLNAAFMGLIWGVLPVLVLPAREPLLVMTTCMVLAGVLCATGFALLILPQAAIAFSVPLVAGTCWGAFWLSADEGLAVPSLLLTYALVMAFVCIRYARYLVEKFASEAKIREQKDIISLLLKEFEDNSSDWLWEFDRNGCLQRVSERFAAAAGTARERLAGLDFRHFVRSIGISGDAILDQLEADIETRRTFSGIEIQISVGGAERFWRLTGKPAFDAFGGFAGYIGTASDITAAKTAERRINYLAHNDALTGLLNRTKFTEHLKQAASRLERYGSSFCVLYLDLDQFKAVNDRCGHLIGDRLLATAGKRIKAALRDCDVAARLGGDEFAIMLSGSCHGEEVAALARRLVETVGLPYEFDGEVISIGVSIGIATAPRDGTRPDQVLRNADLALYRAKAEGRGTWRFFEAQMDSALRERRLLEFELRRALHDSEFVLHYQPLVSAAHKRPSGLEALMRWNHPTRGLVCPAEFIPVAEQTGLIREIGDWTIHEACRAALRWPHDLPVAVNLSSRHFELSDIAAVVREALAATQLAPRRLELEITESLLIERTGHVMTTLTELKALGVTITLDDFGTGYSSISNLLKFRFDKIKIDQSFITASGNDPIARDVLRSIASLGRALKITIAAEGVETEEQVEFLREISFSQLQGFYFARPLGEFDLARYFLSHFELPEAAPAGQRLAG